MPVAAARSQSKGNRRIPVLVDAVVRFIGTPIGQDFPHDSVFDEIAQCESEFGQTATGTARDEHC